MKTILITLIFIVAFSTYACAKGNTVTLKWDAPTTNSDGTPLTDLAGYKIYYGPASGNYVQNIDVGNVTLYTIKNLPDGKYFFSVTAYDTMDNESDYSNEVNTLIDNTAPGIPELLQIVF